MLSSDFLPFFISCLGDMELISLIFVLTEMFTVLKGYYMVSSPAMIYQCYLFLGVSMCLGETDISLVLKLY